MGNSWVEDWTFWRSAVIDEYRHIAPDAFTGRNLFRVFIAGHTQPMLILEPVMALIDASRNEVLMATFPVFWGSVVGVGRPMPSPDQFERIRRGEVLGPDEDIFLGGNQEEKDAADAASRRVAEQHQIHIFSKQSPRGDDWLVYFQVVKSKPAEFLEADGHTLTGTGAKHMESFIRGTVLSAREWLRPLDSSGHPDFEVNVERKSPASGKSLKDSLG